MQLAFTEYSNKMRDSVIGDNAPFLCIKLIRVIELLFVKAGTLAAFR